MNSSTGPEGEVLVSEPRPSSVQAAASTLTAGFAEAMSCWLSCRGSEQEASVCSAQGATTRQQEFC